MSRNKKDKKGSSKSDVENNVNNENQNSSNVKDNSTENEENISKEISKKNTKDLNNSHNNDNKEENNNNKKDRDNVNDENNNKDKKASKDENDIDENDSNESNNENDIDENDSNESNNENENELNNGNDKVEKKNLSLVYDLRKELKKLGLSAKGNKDTLKKRYKKYLAKQKNKENKKIIKELQPYKYYCVVDVEATCERGESFDYPNEIIEFPVVLINSRTNEIIDEFHKYVKPSVNPKLTEFCTELTGITQDVVDKADGFPVVLEQLEEWLSQYSTYPYDTMCFVTDGPWDLRDFVRKQCVMSNIQRPAFFYHWINLRKLYTKFYGGKQKRLNEMLEELGMVFEGREHCGLDDTRNIARIVLQMLKSDCPFKKNIKYPSHLKQ